MASSAAIWLLDGGSTLNRLQPELAEAVKSVRAQKVIFLPNNGNIFLAAKQAKKLVGRSKYIIPSKTIPQGISALLSLNLTEDMSHNLKSERRKAIKG
jgi:dihydroxyacetone kinase-like predicted kinase